MAALYSSTILLNLEHCWKIQCTVKVLLNKLSSSLMGTGKEFHSSAAFTVFDES